MKVKGINASSRKTNKKIREAFAELINEKGDIANITVTDLVRKADITRSSFYNHYNNLSDIAEELHGETLDVLISDLKHLKTRDDIDNYLDEIFDYIHRNENIYSLILSGSDPTKYIKRLNDYMIEEINNIFRTTNDTSSTLTITFFCDGCMSLIIRYFNNSLDMTLMDLKGYIKVFAEYLFDSLSTE